MSLSDSLAELFRPPIRLSKIYVGLLHLATSTENVARFEGVAKKDHRKVSEAVVRWSRAEKRWGTTGLQKLSRHLKQEASSHFERAAVEIGGALVVLDREIEQRSLEFHGEETRLPEAAPFDGTAYRILRPPEDPISQWIHNSEKMPIPRTKGDSEIDLEETLDLHCRIFRTTPNLYGIEAVFEDLPAPLEHILRERVTAGRLTLGAALPLDGLNYEIESFPREHHPKDGAPYRFKEIKETREEAQEEIDNMLRRCRDLHVDVLIYPELTLDMHLLGHLQDSLKWNNDDAYPAMVVAGSFHENADQAGRFVNRARVFDYSGEEILRHDKLKRFRLTADNIAAIRDEKKRTDLCEMLGVQGEQGAFERIEQGRRLRVVDGPLGRMITSICLDYCGRSLDSVAVASRSNLFWVPAMTPSLEKFHKKARELGELCRATSVIVNSEWLLEISGVPEKHREPFRSACFLPFKNSKEDHFVPDKEVPRLRLCKINEILDVHGGGRFLH